MRTSGFVSRQPRLRWRILAFLGGIFALFTVTTMPAGAQELLPESVQATLDNTWIVIAGILVFLMQAGFALVEAGLTRAKSIGNIMMKNLMDCMIGVILFLLIGYSIGFGGEKLGGFFGWGGFGVKDIDNVDSIATGTLSVPTFFFFQAAFAATAATIVSGAMAERTKFTSYFVYSMIITALIYPVVLSWTWGGGWLAQREYPFSDFAGSTIVHATGGWCALMGAGILGPRIGKYGKDGKPRAIPGHNVGLAIVGAMILFICWFGFNAGSELAADSYVPALAAKTLIAACAGCVGALIVQWMRDGKPDVSMAANGMLAGLVSITAPVGAVNMWSAMVIGAIGGVLVIFSVAFFDKIGIDDPVGAISVHGVCGTWGTLSIGLFAKFDDAFLGRENAGLFFGGGVNQLVTQLLMVLAHAVWVLGASGLLFLAIKKTIGLRVSAEEEIEGLDIHEHGVAGYAPDVVTAVPADGETLPKLARIFN